MPPESALVPKTLSPELLAKRHRAERRFRLLGLGAIGFAGLVLVMLLGSIVTSAMGALFQTQLRLPVEFRAEWLDRDAPRYSLILRETLDRHFPGMEETQARRELYALFSPGAKITLREKVNADPDLAGQRMDMLLPASEAVDRWARGEAHRLTERQLGWVQQLKQEGRMSTRFNRDFFSRADSRDPELAGVLGGWIGSLLTIVICLAVAFPIAVMTAVYLQEFAPHNRLTDFIEININNLAAVPSIIFGLLGLSVFLLFFGMPRSSVLVGGMTLALMILPTIIISTRAALRSVPESIRDGARALGATPMQVVQHHVLPLAMPGIMTGTILGIARALGETAPLLMIGMVAFVADVPGSLFDPATVMPVQIYLWSDSPEVSFAEKTSLAIVLLLLLLMCLNAAAVVIRKKYERRW